jgi:hemoglobin
MQISSPSDIKTLVDRFYDKVNQDEILSPIFNEIMQVNWDTHLPIMYQFWGSLLLGEHSYTGNPMQKHIEISKIVPLGEKEFARWLELFNQNIDEHFTGPKAEEAKLRASNIARLMEFNLSSINISGSDRL